MCIANPICLRLLAQLMREAASRAACTAGMVRLINSEMIAMTTSSSISVKPARQVRIGVRLIAFSSGDRPSRAIGDGIIPLPYLQTLAPKDAGGQVFLARPVSSTPGWRSGTRLRLPRMQQGFPNAENSDV